MGRSSRRTSGVQSRSSQKNYAAKPDFTKIANFPKAETYFEKMFGTPVLLEPAPSGRLPDAAISWQTVCGKYKIGAGENASSDMYCLVLSG